MDSANIVDGAYQTKPRSIAWQARTFPSFRFHALFLKTVLQDGAAAKRGLYDAQRWIESSEKLMRGLEDVGVEFEISGMQDFIDLDEPCVFIGNHMSSLETIVLPGLIQPHRNVTFVVKSTLLKYPIFKHIVSSRNPIVVTRTNPRNDLKVILERGVDRLHKGISIVVFPQSTRMTTFDPETFNKIGVKLAVRANVPIVPLALQTDAWSQGIYKTDFGKIDPKKRVHFAFGAPIRIEGRGHAQHRSVCQFINQNVLAWNEARKLNRIYHSNGQI